MTTPNELRTIAQRLHEYKDNPHHMDPMSGNFYKLITETVNTLSNLASSLAALDNCGQVMGRIHHTENGVVCALNSIGLQLPDDARLYAHPAAESTESDTVGETPQESRTAWITVVLQKYPKASISVIGDIAEARLPSGIDIGHWTTEMWSVK